ncbi:MAG: hypothetical protein IIX93_04530 [Clostridia bacterium]|nr:hypothetical protein [Clostridia bacterium]
MKKLLLIALILSCFPALCESLRAEDFLEMEAQLNKTGVSAGLKEIFSSILTGEMQFMPEKVVQALSDAVRGRIGVVSVFLTKASFFMLMTAFLLNLLPEGKSGKSAIMLIHMVVALSLYREVSAFFASAGNAIEALSALVDSITPILVSVIAFTGDAHTSAYITPLGAFVSGALSTYFQKGALKILEALACLCLAGSVCNVPLKKMTDTVRAIFKWLIGGIMSVFLFLMSTGGAIAGAYDGAFVKGLKFAADSLIPIVGSDIAGKMESITGSAQLVKSAAGVTGMIALVGACIFPAVDVFLAMWGLRALSCMLECVSDKEAMNLADGFAGVFSLLFSLILASLCMAVVYVGVAVGIGKRAFF